MNRARAKELAPVMLAYGEGADIEAWALGSTRWELDTNPNWNAPATEYRVKQELQEYWIVEGRAYDVFYAAVYASAVSSNAPITHVREVVA